MSAAATAVADLAGPPPPSRAAASADDDRGNGPSFQEHVDANAGRDRPDGAGVRQAQTDSGQAKPGTDRSSTRMDSNANKDEAGAVEGSQQTQQQPAEAKADVAQPLLLQLMAAITASSANAKPEQEAAQQRRTQQGASERDVQTQAASAEVATAVATATPNVARPNVAAPIASAKSDASVRSQHGKSVKDTAKTEAASSDEPGKAAAPISDAALPATSAQAQAIAAAVASPAIAPETAAKTDSNGKAAAIEGVGASPQATPSPQKAQHAPPSPIPSPKTAAETPQQPNPSNAKPREDARALPRADALKQATQDFAPATSKAQPAPAPAAPPTAPHAQLSAPVDQAIAPSNIDARTQSAPVATQIGGEIIRRFNGQDTSFQLRLDPPDLGRVDVRLDVSRDHRVTAVISADSPQALSDLARGARDLQQALQSAGLDLADDGLRFDLSSNGQGNAFAHAQAQQDQPNFRAANAAPTQPSIAPEISASRPLSIDSWRGARVDLVA